MNFEAFVYEMLQQLLAGARVAGGRRGRHDLFTALTAWAVPCRHAWI